MNRFRIVFIWFLHVLFVFFVKIIGNKFLGGMRSMEKAYSWSKIYDELPYTIIFAVIVGTIIYFAGKEDEKDW